MLDVLVYTGDIGPVEDDDLVVGWELDVELGGIYSEGLAILQRLDCVFVVSSNGGFRSVEAYSSVAHDFNLGIGNDDAQNHCDS